MDARVDIPDAVARVPGALDHLELGLDFLRKHGESDPVLQAGDIVGFDRAFLRRFAYAIELRPASVVSAEVLRSNILTARAGDTCCLPYR
mgnify:CR=1 FL=1